MRQGAHLQLAGEVGQRLDAGLARRRRRVRRRRKAQLRQQQLQHGAPLLVAHLLGFRGSSQVNMLARPPSSQICSWFGAGDTVEKAASLKRLQAVQQHSPGMHMPLSTAPHHVQLVDHDAAQGGQRPVLQQLVDVPVRLLHGAHDAAGAGRHLCRGQYTVT